MKAIMQFRSYLICLLLILPFGTAMADDDAAKYAETIEIFQDAGASGTFFNNSYGYAVFPTIGKGGIGVGGAYGKGRVYVGGKHVGNTSMSQLSIGFQLGAEAFSQIIFFEDQRAYDEFTSGNFEFSADASATAITAGASASAKTTGSSAGASGGKKDATTKGSYHKGMATFTVVKGGLMYEAVIAGQKFKKLEPVM
jgi:lipid-binding SYLF domain-containing protein